MEIVICPNCKMRVAVGDDSTCPSCSLHINDLASLNTPAKENRSSSTHENAELKKGDRQRPLASTAETHFDILSICFSFKGRIPRSVYWFSAIGSFVLFYVCLSVSLSVFGKDSSATSLVFWLLLLIFFWSQIAISVKRFHDLRMSGLWFPLILLPGIGLLVQFILLGMRRGERGENKYGRDPIELFK